MALLLGRSVTKPVLTLATRVQAIEEGNYQEEILSQRKDEIGKLQNSVNHMAAGLAEKEKVRDLLGKVVSREIADELMNSHVELGGERRRITILFSDIRNFTGICEGSTPENILSLLNHYLSEVSAAIEEHKGVVDKYIGDAVMALFGAPIKSANDTTNALKAALQIRENVNRLNGANTENNLPALHTGIGLHTGEVVAGNLGSANRLNYTVIGDPVNLASRLQSLSKTYGGGIIVSEETQNEGADFIFQELDLVRVKGKAQPVRIYELIGTRDAVTTRQLEQIKGFNDMLGHYRKQAWQSALDALAAMESGENDTLYRLFRERIEIYRHTPPGADWDGVFTFQSK
ncbi:adenylate/guanylate cyclase domain-containing protein [Gammaproteobacteria bacterium]|nr:adenylate/guanylate cyclase domain-containing protein [Gammaproteobacteria bacterium]